MNKTISAQLKEILSNAGWSQDQLARRLDIPVRTLSRWLNYQVAPRRGNIEAINKLYQDIAGRTEVDAFLLAGTEKEALSKHITVKELINNEKLLDKLTLYLTYHTNTIEGSTMTLADVKEVLDDNNKILANKTAREQIEARNHRAALHYLLDELNAQGHDFKWTEDLILNIHLRLMNTLISNAGLYRNHAVRIAGSYIPLANFMRVPEKIKEFIETVNRPAENLVQHLAWTHATFEQIHPFSDGNGRTGRLIMFVQALQSEVVPPLIIKERKYAYYKYLQMTQLQEKYDLLRLFIAESVIFTDNLIGQ